MWKIKDHTLHKNGQNMGWLSLMCDDKRVADFFPYAHNADPNWIFDQAHKIAAAMNLTIVSEPAET